MEDLFGFNEAEEAALDADPNAGLIDSETDLFDDDPDEETGPVAANTAPEEGDTAGAAEAAPIPVKPKRVIKNPQPKFNEQRLCGPRGIGVLQKLLGNVLYKGKGYETEDLGLLLRKLQHWTHRLYPKYKFEDSIEQIEKLGTRKLIQVNLKKLRLDMYEAPSEDGPADGVVRVGDDDDDAAADINHEPDVFDELLEQSGGSLLSRVVPSVAASQSGGSLLSRVVPSVAASQSVPRLGVSETAQVPLFPIPVPTTVSELTEEQRARIAANRLVALEKRKAFLAAQDSAVHGVNVSVTAGSKRKHDDGFSEEPPAKKPATDFDEFDDDDLAEDDILAALDNHPEESTNVANFKSNSTFDLVNESSVKESMQSSGNATLDLVNDSSGKISMESSGTVPLHSVNKLAGDFDEFDDDLAGDDIVAALDNHAEVSTNVTNMGSSFNAKLDVVNECGGQKSMESSGNAPVDLLNGASCKNTMKNSGSVPFDSVNALGDGDENCISTIRIDGEKMNCKGDESISNDYVFQCQTSSSFEGSNHKIGENSSQESNDDINLSQKSNYNDFNLQLNDDSDNEEYLRNDDNVPNIATECESVSNNSGDLNLSNVGSSNKNIVETNLQVSNDHCNDINLQVDDESDIEDENDFSLSNNLAENKANATSQSSILSWDGNIKKSDNESSLLNVSLDSEMPQLVLTEEEDEEMDGDLPF